MKKELAQTAVQKCNAGEGIYICLDLSQLGLQSKRTMETLKNFF